MPSITVLNPGQAIIAFTKVMRHADTRYNEMINCKSCDKQAADQWKRDAKFFATLLSQLRNGNG